MGLVDYIFNVIRTPSDFFHILAYLIIVILFLILSLYRFDENLYKKYIYNSVVFRMGKLYISFVNIWSKKIITFLKFLNVNLVPTRLHISSNKLIYHLISLRVKAKKTINTRKWRNKWTRR